MSGGDPDRKAAKGAGVPSSGPEQPAPVEVTYRLLVETIQDYAIFVLDPEGRVDTWNVGAERITGYVASEIIGRHFSVFFPPDALARGAPQRELEVAAAIGRFESEAWRVRKDGVRFWAESLTTALFHDGGRLRGFSQIVRDLTEKRQQEEQQRQSEEGFRLLVEGVQDYAIFMLDPEGRVSTWNAGAERIKGYRAHEIIGQHFSRFYPQESIERGWPQEELRRARQFGRLEDEGWRLRKDGSRFWANVIITALRDKTGRLRGFAKVTRDMTDRKRVVALEEASRQTNEFLAMLAHELRNPLAPIRNAVGVMCARPLSDPALEWSRDVIDRQLGHLTRLVDDLLDVSRITTGKITLYREPLELAAVFARAVEATRPLIEERRQTLEVQLPDEPLRLEGDLTRLAQVLVNLLTNASKYTPEEGHIWLSAAREGSEAVIRVRDDGIGMSAELLPTVFNLFTQGDRNLERAGGGLGLGLTLVHQLVAMHGGLVQASSEGLEQGSEFIVRLPLRKASAEAKMSSDGHRPSVALPTRRRVLVVDDNRDSAESMAMLMELSGHEVQTAFDGPTALALATQHLPEVVLLDLGLPGMTGYEVAERLRGLGTLQQTVLVAMTGYGQDEDRRRTREAGFAFHLVKPVTPAALQRIFETTAVASPPLPDVPDLAV